VIRELKERAHALGKLAAPDLEGLDEAEAARQALATVAAAGLVAFTVPERDGGARTGDFSTNDSVSVRLLSALRDELAYHSGMLDVMLVMQGLGSYPVALGGSERLRGDVLPGVASGEQIAAFALTEPNAGSSLTDVETHAERVGDGWRLSGHKTFISNCGIAHFYTVLARTSGEKGKSGGLSMFFVPADMFGVECEPFEVMAPHPIGDVHFNDCELPGEFLLGEEGQGLGIALGTLGRFRTSVAAAANGFARRALDESLARLSSRVQFGKPLSANQALRFELADMDAKLRGAQLLVDEAAILVDTDGDSALAVARAKLVATESAGWICDRAVQHFGGLGVKRGVMVERLFRDVRALRIYEGSSEIQKLIISKALLEPFR
jgi:acyl-CoA dehydrogenase